MTGNSRTLIDAQLASMADEKSGQLSGRLWTVEQVRIPHALELHDDRLYYDPLWNPMLNRGPWRVAKATGALDAFCQLRDGPGVYRFAQRYGVLGLCAHGLPTSHHRAPESLPGVGCPVAKDENGRRWEPVAAWLEHARHAAAAVRLAAALHQDMIGAMEDWTTLRPPDFPLGSSLRDRRRLLSAQVWCWLEWANVRPHLRWDDVTHPPTLRLAGGAGVGTFGVLAAQLMFAVSRGHGVALCSGCGEAYLRSGRAPAAGRSNFCPTCVAAKVPGRLRQRRSRSRRRAQPRSRPAPAPIDDQRGP
jgi:hypothetical protein